MICMRWRKAKLLQENDKKTYWRLNNKHTESNRKEWKEREICEEEKFVISLYERFTQCTGIYSQPKNPETTDHS